jgi:hypothetical protein
VISTATTIVAYPRVIFGARKHVSDVSALGNVHKLNLNECTQVRDVSALHNVYELHLQKFLGSEITGLENVVKLLLRNSPNVSDITMLKKVVELDVEYCPRIFDFRGLDSLKILTLGGSHCLKIPFHLPGVPEVFRNLVQLNANNVSFSDSANPGSLLWMDLVRIRSLKVSESFIIPFPQSLVHLQSLTVLRCPLFSSLPELPCLGYLCLQYCYSLKNLRLLGARQKHPIYTVVIEYCSELQHIQVSRKICRMKIINVRWVSELNAENQINYLHVENCPELTNIINPENIKSFGSTKESIEESLKRYEDDVLFKSGEGKIQP